MGAGMESLIAEIDAPKAVVDEFRVGFQAKAALAAVRQEQVNAVSRSLDSRMVDGLGQLKFRIDADVYFMLRAQYGPGCWRDNDFLADSERKGLLQRVRGKSDKIMIDMGGIA